MYIGIPEDEASEIIDVESDVIIKNLELYIAYSYGLLPSPNQTSAIDFRSNNINSFESLEKNSIDLYSSVKSVYLQNRENKIMNSDTNENDWGNLDN